MLPSADMGTDRDGAELAGSIREFTLSDIVQFLAGSEKTGRLRLEGNGAQTAEIVFSRGSVVHAASGNLVGEEAFFELMRWSEGQFAFEPDVTSSEHTVRQSSTNLLLEGSRRKDEWSILSQHIPDVELVPEFVLPDDRETGQQITLNTSEWVVLSKIDGHRTIKEIAEAAAMSDYHTCRLLYPLIANKLIRLRSGRGH